MLDLSYTAILCSRAVFFKQQCCVSHLGTLFKWILTQMSGVKPKILHF